MSWKQTGEERLWEVSWPTEPGEHRACTKGEHGLWQGKGPHCDPSFSRERADGICAQRGVAGAAPAGGNRSHFLAHGNSTMGMCQLRTPALLLLTFPAAPSSSPAEALWRPAGSQEQPQGGREEEEGLKKAPYHVGLPAIHINTAVNAPPEIILWLPFPGKHSNTCKKGAPWSLAQVSPAWPAPETHRSQGAMQRSHHSTRITPVHPSLEDVPQKY